MHRARRRSRASSTTSWARDSSSGSLRAARPTRVAKIAGELTAAGFECRVSERIQQDVWYKLWGNMTMNPVSAFTGVTVDRVLDDELANAFCWRVMEEAKAIGAAIGCPIEQTVQDRTAITRKLGAFKTSMLQDVEAGKPLEIDALLTVAREIAQRVNVAAPNLDALLGLTRVFARSRGLYPASNRDVPHYKACPLSYKPG